jgi:FHA domain
MGSSLQLKERGSRSATVGVLKPGRGRVGRGEEHPFRLDYEAVSYDHGEFRFIGGMWFYRDTDSTNGTWFEQQRLQPNTWVPITSGVNLKIANVDLDVQVLENGQDVTADSLVVVAPKGELREFPLSRDGKALVIGGAQGHFQMNLNGADPVSLVIERTGAEVTASNPTGAIPLYKNGDVVTLKEQLQHLDQLEVGPYRVFINLATSAPKEQIYRSSADNSNGFSAETFSSASNITNYDKVKRGLPFGKTDPEGIADDAALQKTYGVEPGFSPRYEPPRRLFAPNTLDGKLLMVTLLFFFLSLGSFLGWLATRG